MESVKFTKNDTNLIKGIAISLLLIHHLFPAPIQSISAPVIYNAPLYVHVSYYSKVCVAMFVVLSGYGLYETTPNNFSLKNFYIKRYTKFYLNYWFIYVIFISIGLLFFDFTAKMNEIYQANFIVALLDFFGLLFLWGKTSINPTWWFISSILFLYFLFPFLKVLLDKFKFIFFILSFYFIISVTVPTIFWTQFRPFESIYWLLFPFVLGMYFAQANLFVKLKKMGNNVICFRILKFTIYIILLILIMYQRKNGQYLNDVRVDSFFGLIIILILNEISNSFKSLNHALIYIGKHSMNIFLFHTFLYLYFIRDILFEFDNAILIFFIFLAICILVSIIIERVKKMLKFDLLYNYLVKSFNK